MLESSERFASASYSTGSRRRKAICPLPLGPPVAPRLNERGERVAEELLLAIMDLASKAPQMGPFPQTGPVPFP